MLNQKINFNLFEMETMDPHNYSIFFSSFLVLLMVSESTTRRIVLFDFMIYEDFHVRLTFILSFQIRKANRVSCDGAFPASFVAAACFEYERPKKGDTSISRD